MKMAEEIKLLSYYDPTATTINLQMTGGRKWIKGGGGNALQIQGSL